MKTKSSSPTAALPFPPDGCKATPAATSSPSLAAGGISRSPVIPERRKPLTRRQRMEMHDRHGSKCVICLEVIPPGEPFIDEHVIPLALGGLNDQSNRGPAHIPCAKIKTKRDQNMIAKAKRMRLKHLGFKKPRTITRWRKMNGEIVHASRER